MTCTEEPRELGLTCEAAASAELVETDGEPVDNSSTASCLALLPTLRSDPDEAGDDVEGASGLAVVLDPAAAPLFADVFVLGARTFGVFAAVKDLPPPEFEKNE